MSINPSNYMETKKVEHMAGTRYVKIDNSIFSTVPKDNTPTRTICECLFCGERFGGDANGKCAVYCKNCKTKEGRVKLAEENGRINK